MPLTTPLKSFWLPLTADFQPLSMQAKESNMGGEMDFDSRVHNV
jgi:hypothetical protein